MPHQCVRCGKIYEDNSKNILTGCECGSKLFFYVKKSKLKKAEEFNENLSEQEKIQIEKDIYDLIGKEIESEDKPVILDFESIAVTKPGKYELDLVQLFKGEPVVIKLQEGKYFIDLKSSLGSYSRKDFKK